jgi:RNA polymerase sigma-70 factor, ECF subfamily
LSNETDAEIARDLIAGKPEAFDRFVQHFRSKLFQYTFLMCGHREDAEEVAQEALLKVFENFDHLREPERVKPWLFRIARNACLMKRRKSVYAPSQELSLDDFLPRVEAEGGTRRLDIADWSDLPEDRLLRSELRDVLSTAIQALPETYRAVVLLRDVEELSTEESAQILEVSADVIKTRLHRARLAIRQKLDGYLKAVRV